ncbi:aldehyde ferredoxin oxidoreductase family protein [Chloroflexota bacterium]
MFGWAGQRLKVYLTEGKIVKEELSEDFRREYLGGRGFNSKTLFDDVKPGIDPMGPENVFMIGAGPLAGTPAPVGARWTATAKAPLTGIFGDGNGGGDFAAELKFAGYDEIVFYGRSPKPVYLWINDDRVELRDASHLWGKNTWDTHNLLIEELGDRGVRNICIGPASENLVRYGKVISNSNRAGGKGGVGTVMGTKNLKAVAVRGTGSIKIAKPEEFYRATQELYQKVTTSPHQQMMREVGTLFLPAALSRLRATPVRNQQEGYLETWEKLSTEAFEAQFPVKHKACASCPIGCGHYYEVKEGPYATYGSTNEYGTLYPFTFKLGSDNLAASLLLTTICDQLGLCTHGTGGVIAWAMEAWQKGYITAKDTDGLDLTWGNDDAVIQLVRKIAYREGFGDILAEGELRASKHFKGSEECLVLTKGMNPSAFFPGEMESKMSALGYATAPIGGSIHRGGLARWMDHPRLIKALGEERVRQLSNPRVYEGQGVFLAIENDFVAAYNAVEACQQLCAHCIDENDLAVLVSTATGIDMDGDGIMKVGERIFNVEKAFNVREGMRREDDSYPPRFFVEEETEWGIKGLNYDKFQGMLDEYYQYRGWDVKTSIPTRKKLEELNLGYIAEQIGAP